MSKDHNRQKILWIIFLTVFIDMLGVGILVPVFPMLILPSSSFKVIPDSWTVDSGFIMAGWLLAAYPLAQFICTPLLGQLSDRFGRRKILLVSIFGTMVSYIIFAFAIIHKDIFLLFIARVIDGCSGGNIGIAQAVIADISDPKHRAKNFGLIGVALGLGFVFGPVLGGVLSDSVVISWFNIATPFFMASIFCLINILLILRFLPETLVNPGNKPINFMRPVQNIIKSFSIPGLKNILPVIFLFNAGFTFFTTFWSIVLADIYHFTPSQIGGFFAYMGVMIILAQGIVVRRMSASVKDYIVLRYSIIGTGLCLLVYYLIPLYKSASYIYYIPPILAVCVALTKAFSNALVTRITPEGRLGEVMGVNSSVSALAQAIPAVLAGYIASYHALLPVLAGGITATIAGILFILVSKSCE